MSEKPTNSNKKSINLANITNKFQGMLTIDLMVEPKKELIQQNSNLANNHLLFSAHILLCIVSFNLIKFASLLSYKPLN
jgi:hypothetical protein